jgi:predicted transcriptional regulator
MSPSIALLSIQHEYSDMIFEGLKQVELRRVRPRSLGSGDLIIVYATSPQKEIVGIVEVDRVVENTPEQLWEVVKDKAGISHQDFLAYFLDSSVGFGIFIRKVHRFKKPLSLTSLKERWKNFHPPQCYKYLSNNELSLFEDMTRFNIVDFSGKSISYFQPEIISTV